MCVFSPRRSCFCLRSHLKTWKLVFFCFLWTHRSGDIKIHSYVISFQVKCLPCPSWSLIFFSLLFKALTWIDLTYIWWFVFLIIIEVAIKEKFPILSLILSYSKDQDVLISNTPTFWPVCQNFLPPLPTSVPKKGGKKFFQLFITCVFFFSFSMNLHIFNEPLLAAGTAHGASGSTAMDKAPPWLPWNRERECTGLWALRTVCTKWDIWGTQMWGNLYLWVCTPDPLS